MTVANHPYFIAMFGYTWISVISTISKNGGRREVLDVFFCDLFFWSFIGVCDICIEALMNMI